jgi:hypothetical protein
MLSLIDWFPDLLKLEVLVNLVGELGNRPLYQLSLAPAYDTVLFGLLAGMIPLPGIGRKLFHGLISRAVGTEYAVCD